MSVRTRFAPSPTGYLHIGGVRTALFCWLFAKKHRGKFILRIDDTDQQRNVEQALEPILRGLRWLGIDWDEGPGVGGPYAPYYQSQRAEDHRAAVERLLAAGAAYRDYASPEEIRAEREAALAKRRPFVYSRRFMAEGPEDQARFEAQGRRAVVRLKMPRQGNLVVDDLVRGRVEFEWAREQDHVIQRADGSCLYHLASAVDDHDLEITHVIRAEEHLSNTPRQVFIARSLGYPPPEYAHLPYVAEPGSKNKLSKRKLPKYLKNRDFAQRVEHGRKIAEAIGLDTAPETFNPVMVDFYQNVGYLPEAILNYLALLGWSLDDRAEHFTRQALLESFSLDRVGKSPASLDPQKLWAFQDRHMQQLPIEQKLPMVLPYLQKAGLVADPPPDETKTKLTQVLEAAGDRIKVAGDILDYKNFLVPDEQLDYDPKALEKRLGKPGAVDLLRRFRRVIENLEGFSVRSLRAGFQETARELYVSARPGKPLGVSAQMAIDTWLDTAQRDIALAERSSFDSRTLEANLREFVETTGIKIGDIIHSIRIAITGVPVGPGLFDCMEVLGKESCLKRIDRAIEMLPKSKEVTIPGPGGEPRRALTQFFPERLIQGPVALQPAYEVEVDKPIRLYSGKVELFQGGKSFSTDGEVIFQWRPSPGLRFSVKGESLGRLNLEEAKTTLCELDTTVSTMVSGLSISSQSQTSATLLPKQRIRIGDASSLNYVVFHVPNFHDCLGQRVRSADGRTTWAGRHCLDAERWKITLDALKGSRERLRQANESRGYVFTHVGRLERPDGRPFSLVDEDILTALHFFLSFARGFWSAPLLAVGFSADRPVWWEWTPRRVSAWRQVESWYPVHTRDALGIGFPGFLRRWNESKTRDVLETAVYWYLHGNTSVETESGVISGYVGLELLANWVLANESRGTRASDHAEAIRALFARLHVSNEIPLSLGDLRQFAQQQGIATSSALLSQLRNSVLHPYEDLSRQQGVAEWPEKMWEARTLCLWYLELAILWTIEYTGSYSSRARRGGWVGEVEEIPWAKGSVSE